MNITFVQSPITSAGATVVCSECGAVITDWIKAGAEWTRERPNQDLHKAWHEKIVRDMALAMTAHLRGND